MNDSYNHFTIMTDLLTTNNMPAFRFVLNERTYEVVGAWDVNGKYCPRSEFNEGMEKLARERESGKQRTQ